MINCRRRIELLPVHQHCLATLEKIKTIVTLYPYHMIPREVLHSLHVLSYCFCQLIRLRLTLDLLSCIQSYTQNLSSRLTHPVDTHMHRNAIHWSGGQPFTAPGLQGRIMPCSRAPQPWQGGGLTPLAVSFTNLFEWESNRQPSGDWTTHSNHWATARTFHSIDLKDYWEK